MRKALSVTMTTMLPPIVHFMCVKGTVHASTTVMCVDIVCVSIISKLKLKIF